MWWQVGSRDHLLAAGDGAGVGVGVRGLHGRHGAVVPGAGPGGALDTLQLSCA